MAPGGLGSDAALLLDDAGEHFRSALDGLVEAHCQDVRELRSALALARRQVAGRGRAAEHKGSDEPVEDLAEGWGEPAYGTSSGRSRDALGEAASDDGLSPASEEACPFAISLNRPGNRRDTRDTKRSSSDSWSAAAKLKARADTFHGHQTREDIFGEQTAKTSMVTDDVSADRLNELIPGLKRMFGENLLQRIVSHVAFEVFSASVILVFCVVTALQMQREGLVLGYELEYPRYDDPATSADWIKVDESLDIISFSCGVLFALEFLLRFMATGRDFLRDGWSYFDLTLILGWVAELLGEAFGSSAGSRALRPIRLARLLRFVRIIHIIRHLESLYFMVRALSGSLKILGWASLLLFAFQTFTAFLITELLNTFYFPSDDLGPDAIKVFEYFGSFARSLLTTFEMAMGNWPIPARVLIEHVSEWFILIFLAHKLSVGFAFLGVINAVFIQETFQVAATDDLTMVLKKQKHVSTQRKKLERLFRSADTSKDGRISRDEFTNLLKHKDVQMWLASMDYHAADPQGLFDMLDYNGSGDLSALEFLTGMVVLRGTARAMDLVGLVEMQLEHDQMLKKLCHALGQEPADEGERPAAGWMIKNPPEYGLDMSGSSDLFRK